MSKHQNRGREHHEPSSSRHLSPHAADAPGSVRQLPIAERISWLIVATTTIVLPLAVSVTGKDVFRLPKQLLLEASGIVLAAVAVGAMLIAVPLGRDNRWSPQLLAVMGAVLLWSTVTTLVSTNRVLSVFSLVTVATAMMLFVAAYNAVQKRSLAVLYVALAPALINAVLAIAQRSGIWNPFAMDPQMPARLRTTAFVGNPNDVGMFLVAPALAAAALGAASRKHRTAGVIMAVIMTSGLLATETLGAIAALSAGVFVLLLTMRPRLAVIGGLVALLLALAVVRSSPARWSETKTKLNAVASGDLNPVLSGRVPAFFAAWRMFQRHPIFGVGPGCFAFNYFEEKIAIDMEHPSFMNRQMENFGEVHNEHLQILAEGGLPAYGIFIAALVLLARRSFPSLPTVDGTRAAFAQRLGLPLAVAIAVLTLSSFPMRLAAPTANGLFICALTLSWGEDESD